MGKPVNPCGGRLRYFYGYIAILEPHNGSFHNAVRTFTWCVFTELNVFNTLDMAPWIRSEEF